MSKHAGSNDTKKTCDRNQQKPANDSQPEMSQNPDSKLSSNPTPYSNPYRLTKQQKQCTMILSTAIRQCLLPSFSRTIEAIFADCYDESIEPTNDPIELIDRRSREAATRLKILIGEAFAQIYHQLLVVGLGEVVDGDDVDDGKVEDPEEDKQNDLQNDSASLSHTSSTSSLDANSSNSNENSTEKEKRSGMDDVEYNETIKLMCLYSKKDRRIRRSSKHLKGNRNRRKKKLKENQDQLFKNLVKMRHARQQQKEKAKKKASKRAAKSAISGLKSSRRVRKLVALVVSHAMAAAIAPDIERLVWALRNEHVAQLRPEAVKPIEMLIKCNHQGAVHKEQDVDEEDEDDDLDADSANTLYGRQREPFRRAVYETFFADPNRSLEPLTLHRKNVSNALRSFRSPNVSHLQRHLLAAVIIAVKSGFLIFLDQQIVLEIGAKFDIRMERRRNLDGKFSFFELTENNLESFKEGCDAYLEDDDESVTIDPAYVSPLKNTANILALRRTVEMWTSESVFRRLLDHIFAPIKKMKIEHFHPQTGRSTVDGTELIDARIGRAAVQLKRYFLRTVSDILLSVFRHMAAYVAVMRHLADADAEADIPTGVAVETAIPSGNSEFEALFKVHVEQTLVDYRNVLVAELDRKPAKTRAELAKLWYSGAYEEDLSSNSALNKKGDKKQDGNGNYFGEAVPEAVEQLAQLLREMYNVSEDGSKQTAWKVYVADMREITVGERSLVIAFSENLRHHFLGAFNNELRWELIVKGVEIQRYDEDEDDDEEEDDEVEDEEEENNICLIEGHTHLQKHPKCSESGKNKSDNSVQKKMVYHEAIDIWTSFASLEPVIEAIFRGENSKEKENDVVMVSSVTSTTTSTPTTTSKGNRNSKNKNTNHQANNHSTAKSNHINSSKTTLSPQIAKAIDLIDMRASRAVHLLNSYFDDAIELIFRQSVCYLNEFVNQVRGAKHKEIKRTIVNCLKNNIPGFSSLYSEMFNRLITAAMASYRNNLVVQLDKPSVAVVQQLVKMFNFGEVDETGIRSSEADEVARQAKLKGILDELFVQRCFTSWPAFEMELMAVINGPESMAHTLMKDLIREFFPHFDAELKRELESQVGVQMRSAKIDRLSSNIPKANMATLKEAIRLWTSPCVIEQTFARPLKAAIVTDRISSITNCLSPPPTSLTLMTTTVATTGIMTAIELIDIRTCEAVHRAQGRLRQAIAQYHKLLVVYFSLYLELFHFESANTKAKYLEMTHNIESINALKRISCYYVEQALCTSRNKFARALYGSKAVREVVPLAAEYARHPEMVARAASDEFTLPDGPEVEEAKSRCFRSIIESLIVLQQDIPVEWQAVDKSGAIHVLNYLLESLLCSIHSAFESRLKEELLQRKIVGRKALEDALDAVEEDEDEGDEEDDEDEAEDDEEDDYEDEEENEACEYEPVKLSLVNHLDVEVMNDEVEVEVELDLERTFLGNVGLCASNLGTFSVDNHQVLGADRGVQHYSGFLGGENAHGFDEHSFSTVCSNKIREIIAEHLKEQPPLETHPVSSSVTPSLPTSSTEVTSSTAAAVSNNNNSTKKGQYKASGSKSKKGRYNKRK